jgi:hypothetical protein
MKRIKPSEVARSLGKVPVAIISQGVRIGGKKPTFIYCLAIVAIIWVLGLWCTSMPLPAWAGLPKETTMIVMGLILGMITAFSLFPAAIYAAFTWREKERARLRTVSEVRHYSMQAVLEKDVNTCFDTIYDPETYKMPVPLATLAMQIGWVLFFFSEGVAPITQLVQSGRFLDLLVNLENAHPVVFGFLGAYFFSLQMLFQRYLTTDLKASVFMHIAVRIWSVMILTLILSVVWNAIAVTETGGDQVRPALLAISFIAGIAPDVALDLIKRAARTGFGKLQSLTYRHISLSKIQGLNLWHQARLSEEGIDSVQNLAMSDIVGLIVNTRLGLIRLLHWVDQALLYIHVGNDIEKFFKAGIHTATDFEFVYMGLPQGEQTKLKHQREEELKKKIELDKGKYVPAVPPILAITLGDSNGLKERIRNEMIAICNDENFQRLRTLIVK